MNDKSFDEVWFACVKLYSFLDKQGTLILNCSTSNKWTVSVLKTDFYPILENDDVEFDTALEVAVALHKHLCIKMKDKKFQIENQIHTLQNNLALFSQYM